MITEHGVHPKVFSVIAAVLVFLGIWLMGSTPHAIHYISVGGLVLVIGGLMGHIHRLHDRFTHLYRHHIEPRELSLADLEKRIQALELAKQRIDANIFPEVKPPQFYDEKGKVVPQHESLDR